MSGNVWEWTDSLYRKDKDWRVLRGGAFSLYSRLTRAAYRDGFYPDGRYNVIGFRVAEHLSDPAS